MLIDLTQDEIYKLRAMLCIFSVRDILCDNYKSAREIDEMISLIDARYDDACKRLDEFTVVNERDCRIDEINNVATMLYDALAIDARREVALVIVERVKQLTNNVA